MKKNTFLYYMMIMLLLVWSCEEKDNLDPVGNWELTTPVISTPTDNASLILNETEPSKGVKFEWQPAKSSEDYQITYDLVIDSADNTNYDAPILKVASGNNGKDVFAELTALQIDQALSAAGYEANSTAELKWSVIATSLNKQAVVEQKITVKRFENESVPLKLYVAGLATEVGEDVTKAIEMRPLKDKDGNNLNTFEVYTSLEGGKTLKFYSQQRAQSLNFGGAGQQLEKGGAAITAPDPGQYRITVDFNDNTYKFLRIDKWSLVGNAVAGGWGGDVQLAYKGKGVWEGKINFAAQDTEAPRFIFRANGDWGYLFKRIKGTTDKVVMESQANGVEFEDIPVAELGNHIVTLNLAANSYTYSIVKDNSTEEPSNIPSILYILNGSTIVGDLTKGGEIFKSAKYIALQAGQSYTINTQADGSGDSYSIEGDLIGNSDNPNGDNVSAEVAFAEGTTAFTVERDQAYMISFDFSTSKATWKYYNLKLFHWSNWDTRDEFMMTYKHPYTFEISKELIAGNDMKFISPWDLDFGAKAPASLVGILFNKGGENIKNITENGTYNVTVQLLSDYSSGTYEFVKQ